MPVVWFTLTWAHAHNPFARIAVKVLSCQGTSYTVQYDNGEGAMVLAAGCWLVGPQLRMALRVRSIAVKSAQKDVPEPLCPQEAVHARLCAYSHSAARCPGLWKGFVWRQFAFRLGHSRARLLTCVAQH